MLTTLTLTFRLCQCGLPFYDFCVFRSVAVNTVYNLQFLTFIYLSTVANELPIEFMNIAFRKFSMCLSVTDTFCFAFKLQQFNLCLQFNYQLFFCAQPVTLKWRMSYSFSVRTFDAWNIAITLINGESDHVRIAYLFAGHFSKVCDKPSSHEAGNLHRLYMNKRTTYIHKHNVPNNLNFLSIANYFLWLLNIAQEC